jgi:hypothetical protein
LSGEQWILGNSHNIRWQTVSGSASTVRLSLYKGGNYRDLIASDTPNTGSYTWLPSGLPTGSDYSIRIWNASYPNNFYDSAIFSLVGTLSATPIELESLSSALQKLPSNQCTTFYTQQFTAQTSGWASRVATDGKGNVYEI